MTSLLGMKRKYEPIYPVNDSSWVDVLQAPKDLIDKELDVVVGQLLGLHDVVQVGAHQGADQVDVTEAVEGHARREDVH